MDRPRIIALVAGLVTVLVACVLGYCLHKQWLPPELGVTLIAAVGFFLMTIRSWMQNPYPKTDAPKDPPNVAGIVLAIAVGSVLAATPCAVCACSLTPTIVKPNPVVADCIADKGIAERECVKIAKTEAEADTCIANVRAQKECTDGGVK